MQAPNTVGRREFIAHFAVTLCAGLLAPRGDVFAAQARGKIDTHHHVFPPAYVNALTDAGLVDNFGKTWSVNRTLDDMERAGVELAVLSVTTPALTFAKPDLARQVARACNEWVAALVQAQPGRFGSFATLPMPDVDGTLLEIKHAFDVLKCDGVCFMTSYGNRWLGHASFAPVFDELHRRKALVYTHPTMASCCAGLLPEVSPAIIEFGTDTTRTIADLLFSGTAARCSDARFIFSHGGGTLPYLAERFIKAPAQNPALNQRAPNGVLHELQRFHYDTAWVAHPAALAALARLVPVTQILLGSDYPYRTAADHVHGLAAYGFSDGELSAIQRGNAERLMPRLRA